MTAPQARIKVLQLIDGFTIGGAETVAAILSKNLDPSCFEVTPCALYRSGPVEDDLKAAGIACHVLGVKRRSVLTGPLFVADFVRLLKLLSDLLRKLSIDIVHCHLSESTLLGILAARITGVPTVCATVHSVVYDNRRGPHSPRQWLLELAIRHVFSRADCIVAVSEEVARKLSDASTRVVTIPNGIDSQRFRIRKNRVQIRLTLGLPSDRLVLSAVGRLSPEKGHSYLLRALALIPPGRRPLTLIVGDGQQRADLERQASTLGLDGDVRFLGARMDIPALLAASDMFVLPSDWEGVSLSLLEAMACGLPVISTRVGGNPEVVGENQSGILVPPRDHEALAEAVRELMVDPGKRSRFGQAGYERFRSKFTLEAFIRAHEGLYRSLHTTPSESHLRPVPQAF